MTSKRESVFKAEMTFREMPHHKSVADLSNISIFAESYQNENDESTRALS